MKITIGKVSVLLINASGDVAEVEVTFTDQLGKTLMKEKRWLHVSDTLEVIIKGKMHKKDIIRGIPL